MSHVPLQQEISVRLIERLDFIHLQPKTILEVSAALGYGTELLKKRYTDAQIYEAEVFLPLPYPNQSMELIVSNVGLPNCDNIAAVFAEMFRVLKPGGLLLFSTLGPDTLGEVRDSWAQVDDFPHVHIFLDLHDVGDALLQAHFSDPVMDMEMLKLQYLSVESLCKDLKRMYATNKLAERRKTLTGKKRFADFAQALKNTQNAQQKIVVTAEVIYGHAWRPLKKAGAVMESGEAYIAIDDIRRSV